MREVIERLACLKWYTDFTSFFPHHFNTIISIVSPGWNFNNCNTHIPRCCCIWWLSKRLLSLTFVFLFVLCLFLFFNNRFVFLYSFSLFSAVVPISMCVWMEQWIRDNREHLQREVATLVTTFEVEFVFELAFFNLFFFSPRPPIQRSAFSSASYMMHGV